MRAKGLVIGGVLVTGLAVIAYVMRGGRQSGHAKPPVQMGLADGGVHTLDAADPAIGELRDLASAAGRALEAG